MAWTINQIYTSADGSSQFIELLATGSADNVLEGLTITSTPAGGGPDVFTIPNPDGISGDTTNKSLLFATQGFATLWGVTPDYIIPAGFLPIFDVPPGPGGEDGIGGTLNVFGMDSLAYPSLPKNSVQSIDGNGVVQTASPTNFAGDIVGTFLADTMTGTAGADSLFGGPGNDYMIGNAGNDYLSGATGNNSIFGGDGDDFLFGGTGNDFLEANLGNDSIRGAAGNDTLRGGDGLDTLRSGGGNDSVIAGPGNDLVYSAEGDDVLRGVLGDDTIRGGFGNDTLFGGEGNDTVYGGPANDVLFGGLGDDFLAGLLNNDTLTGADGNDRFWFNAMDAVNADTIMDFVVGVDLILLDPGIFTSLAAQNGNPLNAANFVSGPAAEALDVDDYIIYDTSTGNLYYDASGDAGLPGLLVATLVTLPALTASNILILA